MAENTQPTQKINPILSILRQPKVYIRLPSGGKYWPEGSLNVSVNGEYPVYSMTARDELLLKTPDALLNGQSMVSIIQNCIPNILNAWDTPQIDLDTILIAIRLATYGEKITIQVTHPSMDGDTDYEVNIRELLEQTQQNAVWEDRLELRSDLVVFLKPLPYSVQTTAQLAEFETTKIIQMVNNSDLSEEDKVKQFSESFAKLTQNTINVLGKAVYRIESTAGIVEDPKFIEEFVDQCDAELFDMIKNRLSELNDANRLKPLIIKSTPDMIERGAPETLEVPFSFDQSNFFG